jgi:RNA polymerase sigma-70 factor (ECF subfamily)
MAFIIILLVLNRNRSGAVYKEDPRSDEELYRRYAKGDGRAFRALLNRHGGAVHGYLTKFIGDAEMATDLTQDVFMRVISAAEDFRGEASFRTFLFRVMRNVATDSLRSRIHRPDGNACSLDDPGRPDQSGPALVEKMAGSVVPVDHKTFSGELSQALESGLAGLPPEQRETFLLREVEGLRFPEIATILGVNESTVKSRMLYAVRSLRQSLAGFGGLP